MQPLNTYIVISAAGPNRDLSKGSREQALWDDHGDFIDALVEEGFILLGGPLTDEGGAVLVVRGESAQAVRERLAPDPWYAHGILRQVDIKRWEVFVDRWATRTLAD